MRHLVTCALLLSASTALAQNQDIFVDEQQEREQQQQNAYPDGYPQAYPATCNPPCPAGHSCQQGACQYDGGVVQPQPQVQPQPIAQPVQPPTYDPRYARAAQRKAIFGFVGAALVLGLGSSSAATSSDQIPSLPLGVATIVVHIITGLIASGAGKAARRGGGRGITGLRVAGWITWALALAGGVALAALGASDVEVDAGPIIGVTALSAVSLISFGIDGVVGAGQARRASSQALTLSPTYW